MKQHSSFLVLLICMSLSLSAQNKFLIDASQTGVATSQRLYGIFFEEINHAGEGGLYAEMVQNRDFEITSIPKGADMGGNLVRTKDGWQERKVFGNELYGWSFLSEGGATGEIRLQKDHPLNQKNPASMRLVVVKNGSRSGVYNSGFWGMNIMRGETYNLSFYARTSENKKLDVTVSLESPNGNRIYAENKITQVSGDWRKYECQLMPDASDSHGRFALTINQPDTLWLDVVSIFPQKTFMNRPNGLRNDMMKLLADLKPAFIRFPGGAIVGGMNLDNRIQWKNSIGDISQRTGTMNLWGYYTTNGLGYHEYLQMCEDLKADALWVCNPGFSDNYRKAEYCKPEEVKLFVQEALDALEYALGPVDSEWGAKRAANGHAAVFPLKYIEIGNEASGEIYKTNYKLFYDAIRQNYPQVKIVSNYSNIPGGVVEIKDDHKYGSPESFVKAFNQYDNADRKGPEIYVGEYGCTVGVGQGNLKGALAEAIYLMGLEKNSDIVTMCSYAPLFFNVNDNAWPVNMIGFNNQTAFGRTSYWVNRMMTENRPDFILSTQSDASDKSLFCISGYDKKTNEIVVKVVNFGAIGQKAMVHFKGVKFNSQNATALTLSHADCNAENSIYNPAAVIPQKSQFATGKEDIVREFSPWSFTILRVKTSKIKIDK